MIFSALREIAIAFAFGGVAFGSIGVLSNAVTRAIERRRSRARIGPRIFVAAFGLLLFSLLMLLVVAAGPILLGPKANADRFFL